MSSLQGLKGLVPAKADTNCSKCQSVISDSRRRAIEMELELMGSSKNICSECFNREAVIISVI